MIICVERSVMHQTPRYVLLVLLELCRLCSQLGIDPPSVIEQKRRTEKVNRIERREYQRRLQKEREAEETERRLREQVNVDSFFFFLSRI